MILKCNCKHIVQDKLYGKNLRVHNECSQKDKNAGRARCTVCSNVRVINADKHDGALNYQPGR